ncbi:MAG: O-antigen ligase family protein [Candidatus Korobacteraceae bacterium]
MSQFIDLYPEPVVTPVPPAPALPQPSTATNYTPGFRETQKAWLAELNNPWRKLGVIAVYGFFFLRFTDLHLIITAKTGFNNYLLYLFGVPALVGLLMSGGLRRAFRLKNSRYFLWFMVLMILSTLFSTWLGGSIFFTLGYLRSTWVCLILLTGLIMTWKELWRMLQLIAVCAAVNVLISTLLATFLEESGRAGVEIGTNGNPNDFAAVLMLVIPFLGLIVCTPKMNIIARALAFIFIPWGLYRMLASGSRGAMIGMIVAAIYLIMKLPHRFQFPAVLAGVLVCLTLVPLMPKGVVARLSSINGGTDRSAVESTHARIVLLQRSLLYTVERPLFGVGPQQFPNFEGKGAGKGGVDQAILWYGTHNSYTEISSETGIPAFIFYVLALTYSYTLLKRVYQRTRRRKPSLKLARLNRAALFTLVAMVGFCMTIAFNNFGYMVFTPILIGLSAVFAEVTEHEFHIPLGSTKRTRSQGARWATATVEP